MNECRKLTAVSTEKAPAAIGPYSQAIACGPYLFVSGQTPICPETGTVGGDDIRSQAEQAIRNIGAILQAAGTDFSSVVKTTCFLSDMGDFSTFNQVYASYFTSRPARSCVAVRSLPKGVKCEVEAIAIRNEGSR